MPLPRSGCGAGWPLCAMKPGRAASSPIRWDYILHEFALGLFALTLSKEDLSAFLSIARQEVESDAVMIVNALHGSSSPLAWSWVHGLSGVSAADPRFQASAAIELAKLARYA